MKAYIIPPGASIDEVVEVAIRAFNAGDEALIADGEAGEADKIVVFGMNSVRIGDIIVSVESFPDEIGPVEPEPIPNLPKGRTLASRGLRMRKGPSTSYGIVRMLPLDTVVVILESVGQWLRVDVDGLEGFVHGSLIERLDD